MRKSRTGTSFRIRKEKQEKLIEYFLLGSTARMAAELAEVNRNTATYYLQRLRELIFQNQEETTMFSGEIEVDESYSVKRPLGLVGLGKEREAEGLLGKHLYLLAPFRVGLLKRGGKVYAGTPFRVCVVSDTKTKTLMPIIREKVVPDSIVYTDGYNSYDVLDVSEFKHFRINNSEKFVEKKNHINGIENFWNQAKRHLRKFNGIPKDHFYLFLRECGCLRPAQRAGDGNLITLVLRTKRK